MNWRRIGLATTSGSGSQSVLADFAPGGLVATLLRPQGRCFLSLRPGSTGSVSVLIGSATSTACYTKFRRGASCLNASLAEFRWSPPPSPCTETPSTASTRTTNNQSNHRVSSYNISGAAPEPALRPSRRTQRRDDGLQGGDCHRGGDRGGRSRRDDPRVSAGYPLRVRVLGLSGRSPPEAFFRRCTKGRVLRNTDIWRGPESGDKVQHSSESVSLDVAHEEIRFCFSLSYGPGCSTIQVHVGKSDFAELMAAMNEAMTPEPEEG